MNNQTDQQQPPPPPTQPGLLANKPARAALCAIIPGIGAVYNREYIKAVVHFTIFAGLTIISESVGVFGLAAFAFYVFTIIDAYRSAEAIARLESAGTGITAAGVGEAHAAMQEYTVDGGTCDGTVTCDGSPGCEYETVYGQYTCDRDIPDCWGMTWDPTVPTCDPGLPTCDAGATCMRYYTCDSQYTCFGEATCDGSSTCWNSTCEDPLQTCDGSLTCTGAPDCDEYTLQGNYTCDGTETCHDTCANWPNCGPTASERTTWGGVKTEFAE